MALKGTIRDFGVADIFQLIGQQAKTGVLVLSNDVDEVRVYFREGAVTRAENVTRPEDMLFGSLMVRAAVVTPEQLDRALEAQQRTLKRLGAVLIELGYATPTDVREFATLQTTETIYRLFEWNSGTYEFESTQVDLSPEGVPPIGAETIVMNGVRMMDEWPALRERLPSYQWVIVRLQELLPKSSQTSDIDFSSFGDGAADPSDVGPNERTVFSLSDGRKTIQQVIDESRLGEFEACRAITTLVANGFVRLVQPKALSADLGPIPLTPGQRLQRMLGVFVRVAISASLVLVLAGLAAQAVRGTQEREAVRKEVRRLHWAQPQLLVLRRALEVYRFSFGAYPDELSALVDARILTSKDLRFPFEQTYFYRRDEDRYTLLPPAE
jgi:hypothetical protein